MAVTKDPVCGMELDAADTGYQTKYQGHSYYFCSEGSQQSFEAAPEQYLHRDASHARED